jgi:hypothetical protein
MGWSPNQAEFESLGVEEVHKRVLRSIWAEDKLREAREWIRRARSRRMGESLKGIGGKSQFFGSK